MVSTKRVGRTSSFAKSDNLRDFRLRVLVLDAMRDFLIHTTANTSQ